tara:strand:+ start:2699 stop:3130 length:432 start_codon:yes stop_codon:yes gene_type:complete
MTNYTNKPTTIFWVIGIIALLWNISGVGAYLAQAYMSDEALVLLPEAEQAYHRGVPGWVTAAFAIAVFAGLIGCITLLLKKKIASLLFVISFVAVIIQFVYNFYVQDFMEVSGTTIAMPILIIIIALFLIWYSKDCEKKGIIS